MKLLPWLKYIIIIFILIAVYSSNEISIKKFAHKASHTIKSLRGNDTEQVKPEKKAPKNNLDFAVKAKHEDSVVSNLTVSLINKILDNPHGRIIFEDLVNKMVTNYHGTLGEDIIHKEFVAKDIHNGQGNKAQCGDIVSIEYTLKQSTSSDNLTPITKKITIGDASLDLKLENGIIGMQETGKRKIMYNSEKENNIQDSDTNLMIADVVLNKVLRKNTPETTWGIFVDKESFSPIGPKIMCGEIIDANYIIRDIKGNKIYNSHNGLGPISFKIGDRNTPTQITNGLIGLVKNKSRISILMQAKDMDYRDTKGVKLLPNNIKPNGGLLILELDTKS